MAKQFHITKEQLELIIESDFQIEDLKCLNEGNKQTRYTLSKDGNNYTVDVFFKKNNTISLNPIGNEESKNVGLELIARCEENDIYIDATSGNFSCYIGLSVFENLLTYLGNLPGVSKIVYEDKGSNGLYSKFRSEIGDEVTLTYYRTTRKFLFQGYLMGLYVEIKDFLVPFSIDLMRTAASETKISQSPEEHDEIEKTIIKILPRAYKSLHPIMAGFVKDSFTMLQGQQKLTDYAPWTMQVLRVLEHRIKNICDEYSIEIIDKNGFVFISKQVDDTIKKLHLFMPNGTDFEVNKVIANIFGNSVCNDLLDCYKYLKANRHELFHTVQVVEGTRRVEDAETARSIIVAACEIIEKTYRVSLVEQNN